MAPAPDVCNAPRHRQPTSTWHQLEPLILLHVYTALAPVYMTPAPAAIATAHRNSSCKEPAPPVYAAPVPVVEYIAPMPAVSYAAPAPLRYVAPAPVVEYIARWPSSRRQHPLTSTSIRSVSSSWVRCASASSGVHRASACRDRDMCASSRVHRASTCHVIRDTSSSRVRCTCTSCEHVASTPAVILEPAPVVKYVVPAPAMSKVAPTPTVYASPAPVMEHIAPAPAVSCMAPALEMCSATVPV